jgi:molecular chaperone DnaK (HSP70)
LAQSRYIIGIDLGTTNSAVAYVDLADAADPPPIRLFKVPQLVAEARVEARPGLPSFLYLPGAHDLPAGSTVLPWDAGRDYAVGEFARDQGAKVPARLISSAKSWLCHDGVDREAAILPWGSPSEVPHLSPIETSARVLSHVREAWNSEMSRGRREHTLEQSEVVLTVPASFDEVARTLTVRAAKQAGFNLEKLTLLEEPQAAFYSWVRSQGEFWQEQLTDGQQVLVCDVGGGTTDFSLIEVRDRGEEGGMSLSRVAVGDHLMLGGDNMDLALARHLERRLVKRAGELDGKQWGELVHACRRAKESLLSPRGEDRHSITITGRGSRVVGGTLKIDLFQDEVVELVLDGFFPKNAFDELPRKPRVGLQELGLPYAQDPAVTRNLAAFLQRHEARPDAILFNGGAMKATMVQDRVVDTVTQWFGREPEVLESRSLDLAVALGAASYGLVLAGKGVRIRGGTARAYYVGVEGVGNRRRGVCLIPFGVEAGSETTIADRAFEVITDRPVSFPLYSSTAPLGHAPGDVVEIAEDDVFLELPPLFTVLRFERGATVPVKLGARLTELGTLQMWCRAEQADHRWDLEFNLRGDAREEEPAGGVAHVGDASMEVDAASQARAAEAIAAGFRPRGKRSDDPGPRALIKQLEALLGAERLAWPGALIRALWGPLWDQVGSRRHGADHEATWFNLAGILLRPGFGDPLDAQRVDDLWSVYRKGMFFDDNLWSRIGWWVLWRRVSGGLNKGQQLELSNKLAPELLTGAAVKAAGKAGKGPKGKKKGKKGKGKGDGPSMNRQELAEMWRAVASLERVPAVSKEGLGDVALRNAVAGRGDFAFWALGRLGTRVPLYGPVESVVSVQKAEAWLDRLLALDWSKHKGVALAVVQLGRLCADAGRDVDDRLRQTLVLRLRELGTPDSLVSLLLEVKVLQESERAQMYGDALPAGLRLVKES